MRILYIFLGFLCLALGIIGAFLPILPTTPFLLCTLFFFTKSSPRLHQWFIQTKLYNNCLKEFNETRALTVKSKIYILSLSTAMMVLSFYFSPNIWGKGAILILLLVEYWFFFFWIKTIKTKKCSS